MKKQKISSANWRTGFDLDRKKEDINNIQQSLEKDGLWSKPRAEAINLSQDLVHLKKQIEEFDKLLEEFELLKEIGNEEDFNAFNEKLRRQEVKIFLSGKYDKGNAILHIMAGAGGQDAQDWATMLLRMYERYCESKGYKLQILSQSFGEGGGPDGRIGTKQVFAEIKGDFTYGFLKNESGVHRLVRLSPFSAKNIRHTSFALVEILPEVSERDSKINLKPDDLRIDFYRSSGPGGQNVNKRETAVRITHLPTGIVASSQSERNQGQNREKATSILLSKLYLLDQKQQEQEIAKLKGQRIEAEWGSQIRNYVLHPYKLVKDLRTGVETSSAQAVLDGDLEPFVQEELRIIKK